MIAKNNIVSTVHTGLQTIIPVNTLRVEIYLSQEKSTASITLNMFHVFYKSDKDLMKKSGLSAQS